MKKCIYTIHFGGYDAPHEPVKSEGWDYIMFTNRTDIKSEVWDVRHVTTPLPNYLAARYVYINSHLFVPKEYDYSLMVGGQIHINGDLNNLDIDFGADFNMMKHPCRTCIYQEAEIIQKENIDKSLNFISQMAKYRKDGFPKDYGLNACGIIGRQNNQLTTVFEKEWWNQVLQGSYRDQLSFDYVRWRFDQHLTEGLKIHNWGYWETLAGEIFSVHQHGTGNRITG